MRTLLHDLSYGLRQLRKAPGFTAVALITLALGIGANTAIFTLVHAVMLRPLPVKDPGALYRLGSRSVNCCVIGGLQDEWDNYSYALYKHIQGLTPGMQDLAAFQSGSSLPSVRRAGDAAAARAMRSEYVSGNYFQLFGLQAAAGRLIALSDDVPNATPVAVLSHRAWQNYFAGDPSVVGATFTFNGKPLTVVGVAPATFFGDRLSEHPPDFWLPLAAEPVLAGATSMLDSPGIHWLYVMGRLKPGASPRKVQAGLNLELQQWLKSGEGASTVAGSDPSRIAKQKIQMLPASGGVNALEHESAVLLRLLMATSGLVLLIACANVANLLLARGAARKGQICIRVAMGAGRWRLIRQLLTESALLAVIGGAVGLVLAFLGARSILAVAFRGSDFIPIDPHPSLPVLFFSFGLSLLTGLVFGVAPAWIISHADPADTLRSAARTTSRGTSFSQKCLVAVQAALSLVLVTGAILLSQSLRKLEHQNFGFQTGHRYMVNVGRAFEGYSPEKLAAAYRTLQQRLNAIPGVITASYSLYAPMGGTNWSGSVHFMGSEHQSQPHASWLRVSPDYFPTVGTRLLRGRTIGEQDTPASMRVAVVNEAFATKFFPGQDPIGKRFGDSPGQHINDYEIVGVVEDTKYVEAREPAWPTYFLPFLQDVEYEDPAYMAGQIRSNRIGAIELHVAGAPENLESSVRRTLSEMDPEATVLRFTSFGEQVSQSLNQERLLARLTTLFGILAIMLAAVGLYGVTAYSVERKTNEIGVRMAIGANRGNVISLVLRGAFRQVAVGLAIGVGLSLLAGRALASQLFEVKGHDPLALIGAAVLLAVFALVAGFVPARRAANIDPVSALRSE